MKEIKRTPTCEEELYELSRTVEQELGKTSLTGTLVLTRALNNIQEKGLNLNIPEVKELTKEIVDSLVEDTRARFGFDLIKLDKAVAEAINEASAKGTQLEPMTAIKKVVDTHAVTPLNDIAPLPAFDQELFAKKEALWAKIDTLEKRFNQEEYSLDKLGCEQILSDLTVLEKEGLELNDTYTRSGATLLRYKLQARLRALESAPIPLSPEDLAPDTEVAPAQAETNEGIVKFEKNFALFGKEAEMSEPKVIKTKLGEIAFITNRGIGYKDENEDALVIGAEQDAFSIIDGMGGVGGGAQAANIMAEQILNGWQNGMSSRHIQESAHRRMAEENLGGGGACYASTRIEGNILKVAQAGDVRVIVIREGKVVWSTEDEGSILWPLRNVVDNAITGENAGETVESSFTLEIGDMVVGGSDGLFDNFDERGQDSSKDAMAGNRNVASIVAGKSSLQGAQDLFNEVNQRMEKYRQIKDRKGKDQANLDTTYKPDNLSLFVYTFGEHSRSVPPISPPTTPKQGRDKNGEWVDVSEPRRQERTTGREEQVPVDLGISETELASIPEWSLLSAGQQRLARENFRQVMLGLSYEQADALMANRQSGASLLRRAWHGLTMSYQKRVAHRDALQNLTLDTSTKRQILVELIEGIQSHNLDAREIEGELEILFAQDLLELETNPANREVIQRLNEQANVFSKMPHEWSLESASKKEREQYDVAREAYYASLGQAREVLGARFRHADSRLDTINEKVLTQQLINNNPELDKAISKIKSPKFWRAVGEKVAYAGLGYAKSSAVVAASALGVLAGPLMTSTMGAIMGRHRGKQEVKGAQMSGRRGGRGKTEIGATRTSKSEALEAGLAKLSSNITTTMAEGGKLDPIKLRNLLASVENAEELLTSGLIDFGKGGGRVARQYKLLEAMSMARGIYSTYELVLDDRLSNKMETVREGRRATAKKASERYVDKQILKGAAWGLGANLVGQAVRHFWPFTGGSHTGAGAGIDTGAGAEAPGASVPLTPDATIPEAPSLAEKLASGPGEHLVSSTPEATGTQIFHTIKEGESLWSNAKGLISSNGISKTEFAQAWSNPDSVVTLPDGTITHISNVDLVHAGDKLVYIRGSGGELGHFGFENSSGVSHGTELTSSPEHIFAPRDYKIETNYTPGEGDNPLDTFAHSTGDTGPEVASQAPQIHTDLEEVHADYGNTTPEGAPLSPNIEALVTSSGHVLSAGERAFIESEQMPLGFYELMLKSKVKIGDLLKVPEDKAKAIEWWAKHRASSPAISLKTFGRTINLSATEKAGKLTFSEYEGYAKLASRIRAMLGEQYKNGKIPSSIKKLALEKFLTKMGS